MLRVNTKEILYAVASANPFMAPAVGELLISGKDSHLIIKASDFDESIVHHGIKFESDDLTFNSFDTIAVDGNILAKSLKGCRQEDTLISLTKDNLVLKSSNSTFKVPFKDITRDFELSTKENGIQVDAKFFKSLKYAFHCIDKKNPKAALNGCNIVLSNGELTFSASDTRRLCIVSDAIDVSADTAFSIIIERKSVDKILKLFATDEEVIAFFQENCVIFKSQSIIYETKYTNDKFPELKRIVANTFNNTLVLNRLELIELYEQVSVFDIGCIHFNVSNGVITLSDEEGNASITYEIEDKSASFKFAMNSLYMLECLQANHTKNITIKHNDQNLPITIQGEEHIIEIIMPVVQED